MYSNVKSRYLTDLVLDNAASLDHSHVGMSLSCCSSDLHDTGLGKKVKILIFVLNDS